VRTTRFKNCPVFPLAVLLLSGGMAVAQEPQPVAVVPDLTKGGELQTTGFYHLGPTGAQGRMHVKDFMTRQARQILITKVDEGSPASAVLEVGDVILGIGDGRFKEDPRKSLGRAITKAETEANKGVLKLLRWRKGKREVVSLQLRVMGTFSDTAPYDCPKSKKIMNEALRYLATRKKWSLFSLEALAFLASGKPGYIRLVRDHLHEAKWAKPDVKCGTHAWTAGYRNLVLTEYYLATRDKYVLPAIREYAVKTAMGQSGSGTWGHSFALPSKNGGRLHGRLGGYGELNAAGLPCFLSLVLSRKCGVKHAEIDAAIARSSRFFRQFVGKGTIGYGFHRPSLEHYSNGRNGDSSNGKNATAAVAFSLLGDRDAARYFTKMVTSSYHEREYGHSGNSFSQFWGAPGAHCGGPKAVAAFRKELRWYSALTRRADGRFVYQPLGGTYGRPALSVTVAHVLANALPLRKIHITGKGLGPNTWLDDAEVKEAVDAGRWRWADYDRMGADELIERLDCWSPAGREWIAEALGEKEGNFVPRLLKMLASDDSHRRAGACTALGYQRQRAASAVPALSKALSDTDSTVRVVASYALMRIGEPARKAVPDMLRAVLATREQESMRPTQQAVAYCLGHKGGGTAPLYFTGMFASWPEGENPLEGLDRQLLVPAITKLMKHPSARVRGCAAYAFRYLRADDIATMAQGIYDVSSILAPSFAMFNDLPRNHGLDLMAKHRFAEGIPLCLDTLDTDMWGKQVRFPNRFGVLKEYGGAAKSVLPRLKELRWLLRTYENRSLLEETIKAIESDKSPAKLTSLAALVDGRLARELASAKSKQQRVGLCRKLMDDHPKDYFLQAAGLRQLVSMLGPAALDDVLAAVGNSDERLRTTAVELAAGLPGRDVTDKCVEQLAVARGEKLAGVLEVLGRRGDAKVLPVVRKYLKHEKQVVRVAAIKAVAASGSKEVLRSLRDILARAEGEQERRAIEEAVLAACRSIKSIEKSTGPVLAAVRDAPEAARCSLIRVLGQLGGAKALATVAAAVGNGSASVRETALEALATSPDQKATDVLLALAEKASRGRRKTGLLSACLRRVVTGRVPSQQRLRVLDNVVALGGSGSTSRTALDELPWLPSAGSLRMARSWMHKRDQRYGNTSEHAAKVAVAIAQGMDMNDREQRQAAIEALKEVLSVAKDEKTTDAAKAFIAQYGSRRDDSRGRSLTDEGRAKE